MSSHHYIAIVVWLTFTKDRTFFPGHAAAVHVRINGREHVIGVFGILHPTVLEKFDLRYEITQSSRSIPYRYENMATDNRRP